MYTYITRSFVCEKHILECLVIDEIQTGNIMTVFDGKKVDGKKRRVYCFVHIDYILYRAFYISSHSF